jgi:hypothetical protein
MADDGAFADLRKLSEWFARSPDRSSGARSTIQPERIARRLGATAVPLLGRELRHPSGHRRDAAREVLAMLATTDARARIVNELRGVTTDASGDEAKVCALGLLSELGEHGAARFSDPTAMQRRSALALAAQIDGPADVASAADMMVRKLDTHDMLQILEVLVEAAPAAAHELATELAMRLDLDEDQRERIAAFAGAAPARTGSRKLARPTHVSVLVDAAARIVVVASRKVSGERRCRRWAVLIGASGCIDDCLHEDDGRIEDGDGAPLIANLCADGYRVASCELDHARTLVVAAVRRTTRSGRPLTSAYYLGRDLLDLRDAHAVHAAPRAPTSILARALELLADGDPGAARALLDQAGAHEPASEVAAAIAACLLAQGELAAALAPLERAIAADPTWPLHHWNLATALHRLGDARGCHRALHRFIATSAAPTGLYGDPDQPGRVACAERMLAEIERTARLTGASITGAGRARSARRVPSGGRRRKKRARP